MRGAQAPPLLGPRSRKPFPQIKIYHYTPGRDCVTVGRPFVCPFVRLSICLSLSVCLSVCPSVCLYPSLSVRLSRVPLFACCTAPPRVCCCAPGGHETSSQLLHGRRTAAVAPQHGGQQHTRAVSRCQLTYEAESTTRCTCYGAAVGNTLSSWSIVAVSPFSVDFFLTIAVVCSSNISEHSL